MNTMRYKSIGYIIITREHAHDRQRKIYMYMVGLLILNKGSKNYGVYQ